MIVLRIGFHSSRMQVATRADKTRAPHSGIIRVPPGLVVAGMSLLLKTSQRPVPPPTYTSAYMLGGMIPNQMEEAGLLVIIRQVSIHFAVTGACYMRAPPVCSLHG